MACAYRHASVVSLLFVQAFVLFICRRGNPPFSHSHSSSSSGGSGSVRSRTSGTLFVGLPSTGPAALAAEVTASEETAGEKSRELTPAPGQQSTEELGYDDNFFFTVGEGIARPFPRAGTATDSTADGFNDGSGVNGSLDDSYSGAAGYSLKEGDAGQKKVGVGEEYEREDGEQEEEEEERPPIRRRLRKHEPDDDVYTLLRGAQNDHHQHSGITSSLRRPMPSNQTNSNNDTSGYHDGTATAAIGEKIPTGGSSAVAAVGGGTQEEVGMVRFRLEGRVDSFMAGNAMREYLNLLVDESVAATKNQTCNIAFVKTHKTASTTAATLLYRYGKRHDLNVAHFHDHQSSIELPEAIEDSGKPVDLMHYHHAWDGFYEGSWAEAKAAYKKIMRDPTKVNLVTVMREPVAHYMSYYYYFLQPETGLSIAEYFELSAKPGDPRYHGVFQRRRAGKAGWHGFKLLHNPLCAEFGIRTATELERFIRDDLQGFAMVLLTEHFEEGLAVFMRMFNWRPIDMSFCRVIETKEGVSRYDGKKLTNVPKTRDLPPEVMAQINRQTQLDQALYKAGVKVYLQKRAEYQDNLEVDVRRIRTVQSAVHGYLEFNPKSPAHKWYEGDVKCFATPSPVQPF
ncbi:unnamed protein product [Ectocarpus sp. 12 AP-2014]